MKNKRKAEPCYFPEEVKLIKYRGKLVLVDTKLWDYEESILCTIPIGHSRSEISDFMLEGFAKQLEKLINEGDTG